MSEKSHLFLALSRKGWGEATLGVRVASELIERGDRVAFFGHESMNTLFSGGPIPFESVPEHLGPLFKILLADYLETNHVNSLILSDFMTCDGVLRGMGMDPRFLHELGPVVIAIDTWDSECTGRTADMFCGKKKSMSAWTETLSKRMIPVPIARPDRREGAYANLPEPLHLTRKVRNHVRANLGISAQDRAVFFCTAAWQQTSYGDEHGERIAAKVPRLLAAYLDRLGEAVHLIHVGPSSYDLDATLGGRYHWFPPLNAERFALMLGSSDLLLSANISATTIAKALVSDIPTVVVENSIALDSLAEAPGWFGHDPSPLVTDWLKEAAPIYPFRLWPLGLYAFLDPLLASNSYNAALEVVELLNETRFVEVTNRLLFDEQGRHDRLDRQAGYVRSVKSLPRGADIIAGYLGA